MMDCKWSNKQHTVLYWIEDPNDPVPAPYSVRFDNHKDALEWLESYTTGVVPNALRWIRMFRSDNEHYECYRWENPESYKKPVVETIPVKKEKEPLISIRWDALWCLIFFLAGLFVGMNWR